MFFYFTIHLCKSITIIIIALNNEWLTIGIYILLNFSYTKVNAQLKTKRTKKDNTLKCISEKINEENKQLQKAPKNFLKMG